MGSEAPCWLNEAVKTRCNWTALKYRLSVGRRRWSRPVTARAIMIKMVFRATMLRGLVSRKTKKSRKTKQDWSRDGISFQPWAGLLIKGPEAGHTMNRRLPAVKALVARCSEPSREWTGSWPGLGRLHAPLISPGLRPG
jgi:hypothetical protein